MAKLEKKRPPKQAPIKGGPSAGKSKGQKMKLEAEITKKRPFERKKLP